MRAVIAYAPGSDVRDFRQALLGAGLDCVAEDCVCWGDLAVRLSQSDTDLVVVKIDAGNASDWSAIREAVAVTRAPVVAVGPDIAEAASAARQAGVREYLIEGSTLRDALDQFIDRLAGAGRFPRRRGTVISVAAVVPGSGGSTVALNLAGALEARHRGQVALVELTRDCGDLSVLLNTVPEHTIQEACRRWQTLDALSLGNHFHAHPSGLRLLLRSFEPDAAELLNAEAVRRIAVLVRLMNDYTVLALDSLVADEGLAAMLLSDIVVMVMRADVLSVQRARWAMEKAIAAGVPADRLCLVLNRWGQAGQLTLKQVEAGLGAGVHGMIVEDPARVNRAANHGILLRDLPWGPKIARQFAKLAAAFDSQRKA